MFSSRGYTQFDYLQLLLAIGAVAGGTIWPLHLPWQLTVPIALIFGLPAANRFNNGLAAKERAKQEALQDYFNKGGE